MPAAHPTAETIRTVAFARPGEGGEAVESLAEQADLDQLQMLFDYARARYLLTPVQTDLAGLAALQGTLDWIVSIAEARGEKALAASARSTNANLRIPRNIFGEDDAFAALGSFDEYRDALTAMLELFTPIEAAWRGLAVALNNAVEQRKHLENVQAFQDALVLRFEDLQQEKVRAVRSALTEIETLEDARKKAAELLAGAFNELSTEIKSAIGLTGMDFANLFTQLSFTNLENPALGASMLLSQGMEMATKAIDNVPTDLGVSVNKNFVVRRIEFLNKTVTDLAELKKTKEGIVKVDPTLVYRLRTTREQVDTICSNFFKTYKSTVDNISSHLETYIEVVEARNDKVETYNQLLCDLGYVRGQLDAAKLQRQRVGDALQGAAQPGLPAMASFSRNLRRHAWERCIEQLYIASRVYTMHTLDLYDVFGDVLRNLGTAEAADLDVNALKTGLIDLISKKLDAKQRVRTNQESFLPEGKHAAFTLTDQTHPTVLAAIRSGRAGRFTLSSPGPTARIDDNPFAGMADVRLSHIRCRAEGIRTADNVHTVALRHSGVEWFVREDGKRIVLRHTETLHMCTYNATTGRATGDGALDADHRMIGPFCDWEISIPRNANAGLKVDGLTSITIEFQGMYRGALWKTEEREGLAAGAGGGPRSN